MNENISRILAVEIRADRIGYAVFEIPNRFVDFGAACFDSPLTAKARITRLFRIFRPTILVLRRVDVRRPQESAMSRAVAKAARGEARKLSIQIAHVSPRAFRKYYQRNSCRNKYDVAALLASWYPEIAWRLPTKRKFYGPEPRVMIYFDSAALGAAYLGLATQQITREP